MLLSFIGGLDLDGDVDLGDGGDTGGIGWLKGTLTFISIGSWIMKIFIASGRSIFLAIGVGVASGILAVTILSLFFRWLLKHQENTNWNPDMAIGKSGKVYLKIPAQGSGLVHVLINGAKRELKATSLKKEEIPTGTEVYVDDYTDDGALVSIIK